mmetsp:Transcript_10636/g.34975  ORF Transcript_10636/g.34975 Transcript_10636/m.34975 type:complete len:241 (-) Transcript_10636:1761-2483(-)
MGRHDTRRLHHDVRAGSTEWRGEQLPGSARRDERLGHARRWLCRDFFRRSSPPLRLPLCVLRLVRRHSARAIRFVQVWARAAHKPRGQPALGLSRAHHARDVERLPAHLDLVRDWPHRLHAGGHLLLFGGHDCKNHLLRGGAQRQLFRSGPALGGTDAREGGAPHERRRDGTACERRERAPFRREGGGGIGGGAPPRLSRQHFSRAAHAPQLRHRLQQPPARVRPRRYQQRLRPGGDHLR